MTPTDPRPNPGSVVRATVQGQRVTLTIARYSLWTIHTTDWRTWWLDAPGHDDGQNVHHPEDRLYLNDCVHPAPARVQEVMT